MTACRQYRSQRKPASQTSTLLTSAYCDLQPLHAADLCPYGCAPVAVSTMPRKLCTTSTESPKPPRRFFTDDGSMQAWRNDITVIREGSDVTKPAHSCTPPPLGLPLELDYDWRTTASRDLPDIQLQYPQQRTLNTRHCPPSTFTFTRRAQDRVLSPDATKQSVACNEKSQVTTDQQHPMNDYLFAV